MTTFQIDTNDKNVIEDIKKLISHKFHLQVKVVSEKAISRNKPKTKWAEFANKMDGVFTPNIVNHIEKSRQEARENFTVNK